MDPKDSIILELKLALQKASAKEDTLRAALNQAIELLVTATIEPEQITEEEIHELRTVERSV